jgi:hypothetical protein
VSEDITTDDDAAAGEIRTYSLEAVAAAHLPRELKDPVRWLSMRLNRGELRGVRLGRHWRMREADVEYMLERYSNDAKVVGEPNPVDSEHISVVDGLSTRSRRRLRTLP